MNYHFSETGLAEHFKVHHICSNDAVSDLAREDFLVTWCMILSHIAGSLSRYFTLKFLQLTGVLQNLAHCNLITDILNS